MDNRAICEKLESAAMKLLECVEKAAEKSAARCTTTDLQNVKDVVDSALKLLEHHKSLVEL